MSDPAYLDPHTGRTYPIGTPRWCGDDKQPLLLTPRPGLTRMQIDTGERSLWRYRAAFPFAVTEPISLGEGMTPLIARTLNGAKVLLKCDWMNPTGSFKDRAWKGNESQELANSPEDGLSQFNVGIVFGMPSMKH